MRYRVRAHNTATASTNKIHDDAVARSLGFRGGLVPGVDVYAYLCHLPAERWGRAWLERGTISVRFESPVYDGDEVEVTATASGPGSGSGEDLALVLVDSGGGRCATGSSTMAPAPAPAELDVTAWPSGPPPADPPPASPEALDGATLGCIESGFRADLAAQYLDDVREDLPLFREERVAHPGWLLRQVNSVLVANVRLGPWIHVGSTVQLLSVVEDGDRLQTRALVTGLAERNGHRFVDLDVLQLVGDRPVARTAHTAIYRPRGT